MRDELFEQLKKEFPKLYRDLSEIECRDGWYNVIRDLSVKLEKLIEGMENPSTSAEYLPAAIQVKQKFGGLRFYMTTETDDMFDAIRLAEHFSYHTCEECGAPGQPTEDSWIVTLCREHWPKKSTHTYDELERIRELAEPLL